MVVVLTGGTNSQGIRFWDIRAKKLVYELSTGNNIVRSLAWSATDSTLYASTVCEYVDRMGGRHGYRKARIPKRKSKKTRSESESAEAEDEDEEMGNEEEWEDEDEDEDDGNSDPELMDYYDTVRWPKKAYHLEDYFGEVFDCGTDALCKWFSALNLSRRWLISVCSPVLVQRGPGYRCLSARGLKFLWHASVSCSKCKICAKSERIPFGTCNFIVSCCTKI